MYEIAHSVWFLFPSGFLRGQYLGAAFVIRCWPYFSPCVPTFEFRSVGTGRNRPLAGSNRATNANSAPSRTLPGDAALDGIQCKRPPAEAALLIPGPCLFPAFAFDHADRPAGGRVVHT